MRGNSREQAHGRANDKFSCDARKRRMNPGGGYRLLLAGMDKVTASVGEFLRAGEPVGEMGSGPASVTLFGEVVPDGRPVLYIEFRDGTEAIDSGPWWIGGLKEASG